MSRNLVIIRAGDQSLHPGWSKPSASYDLIVSYYGDDPERFRQGALLRHDVKGGKLEAMHRLFADRPLLLERYDFFWIPDDDILIAPDGIDRLFQAMATHQLAVAQPALDEDSYVNLRITARHEGFLLRFTNFVEVMAPCLSRDLLRRTLTHFAGNRFGWGMDWYWSALAERSAAILDYVTMTHTRAPKTGALYADGNPKDELEAFMKKIGWQILPRPVVHHAITAGGELLEGRNPALGRKLRAADGRLRMKGRAP